MRNLCVGILSCLTLCNPKDCSLPGFFFFFFLKFYFIFKIYINVLVLPNIKMNPPQVYMCSPSWTLLPPPSPFHPPGFSIHGSFQERMLEWVAISYSRGCSWPRDWSRVCCISCLCRRILYHCGTWKALYCEKYSTNAHFSRNLFSTYMEYSSIFKKKKKKSVVYSVCSIPLNCITFFPLCCEECYIPESDIKNFGYISETRWYPHIY